MYPYQDVEYNYTFNDQLIFLNAQYESTHILKDYNLTQKALRPLMNRTNTTFRGT